MLVESLEPMREFEGSLTKRLVGHSGPVYACKFMYPDCQRLLVSVSQDGTARLWSLDTFSCLVAYRGHSLPVWDVDVAPLGVGPYFVTASADRTARLWSTNQIHALRIFSGHLSDVDAVRFHPNGNYVVTGSSDKTCRMWDVQSGACVRIFTGHARAITAVAVSPDGRLLASADQAGQVRLWDLAEGRLVRAFEASPLTASHPPKGGSPSGDKPPAREACCIYTLEFDRDGRLLASAGADQAVTLWDVAKLVATNVVLSPEEACLSSYRTKQTPVLRLCFTYRNVLLGAGPFSPTPASL